MVLQIWGDVCVWCLEMSDMFICQHCAERSTDTFGDACMQVFEQTEIMIRF